MREDHPADQGLALAQAVVVEALVVVQMSTRSQSRSVTAEKAGAAAIELPAGNKEGRAQDRA